DPRTPEIAGARPESRETGGAGGHRSGLGTTGVDRGPAHRAPVGGAAGDPETGGTDAGRRNHASAADEPAAAGAGGRRGGPVPPALDPGGPFRLRVVAYLSVDSSAVRSGLS